MKTYFLLAIMSLAISLNGFSQNASVRKKEYNLENGVAIQGYDPVAYFAQGKAIKGKSEFSVSHQAVTYRFTSKENKDAFIKNPSRYEPEYGGWCAYAMGEKAEKVEIDPGTFKIINDKLYLFYNKYFNNTLKDWNKDEPNLKRKADSNWKKFIN